MSMTFREFIKDFQSDFEENAERCWQNYIAEFDIGNKSPKEIYKMALEDGAVIAAKKILLHQQHTDTKGN